MKPYLIFLHGLLGTQADWQKLTENLPHFHCVALDLPFHGGAKNHPVQDFDDTCAYVAQHIQSAVGNHAVLRSLQSTGQIQPARADY